LFFLLLQLSKTLVFLLLQLSKNSWFICSSSLLKTFGLFAPPGANKPTVFRKLEQQESQMF
jgi:hypothetical protein